MKMFSIDEIQRPAAGKLMKEMTEIMGDLASIQSRVARLLVEFSRDVQKSPDPQGSSNRDLSAVGEVSSSAVPQVQISKADANRGGKFAETLVGRQRFPSAAPTAVAPKAVEKVPATIEVAPPKTELVESRTLVADEESLIVHGPLGSIQMPKATVRILARMSVGEGGLYDTETLREIGDFPTIRSVNDHFAMIKPRLRAIGVDLVSAGREMFRVRRLGA